MPQVCSIDRAYDDLSATDQLLVGRTAGKLKGRKIITVLRWDWAVKCLVSGQLRV